jgi:hypothetical protein
MISGSMPRDPAPAGAGQPVPVETGHGTSVFYQNRYLYSRFDPEKNPLTAVAQATILPETLVFCTSPLLGYGLRELLGKLPESSFILAVERDENLMALSVAHITQDLLGHPLLKYVRTASSARILETIDSLEAGPFRRCLRIDLSGGTALNEPFYAGCLSAIDEYISRYWRNHVTLMKLGRNYARNFFRNARSVPASEPIFEESAALPVLVAGAGPSLDESLPFIRENRKRFFLLAVDAALGTFRDAEIVPDAVILVESQYWIERAFAGFRDSRIPVYADLTARPQAIAATGGPVRFFFTAYTKSRYLDRFRKTGAASLIVPPLGSVGLSALFIARHISLADAPVFFTGLDFSWGNGFTHSKGAPAVRALRTTENRLHPANGIDAAFSPGVTVSRGKNGEPVNTDPALTGYAELCRAMFGKARTNEQGFIDIGKKGLDTGCTTAVEEIVKKMTTPRNSERAESGTTTLPSKTETKLAEFLMAEHRRLLRLRDILTGKEKPANAREEVARLVNEADYLYLHFPDGYRGYRDDPDFLKRVRIELEYFLKAIERV